VKLEIPWLHKLMKKTSNSYVGVSLCKFHPSVVLLENGIVANSADFAGEQAMDDLSQWLDTHVDSHAHCVISLEAKDYELLLVESVDVPEKELADALSFKVKDLLPHPIEEMILQAFKLPEDAYRGRMSMAYVVAVKRELIQQKIAWAEEHELEVLAITIPDICILNLFAHANHEGSIAVLSLGNEKGEIRLYKDGALYLTRNIEMGMIKLKSAVPDEDSGLVAVQGNPVDDLELEIQRSIDYYESQLGMGGVSHVYLLTFDPLNPQLLETLKQNMSHNIDQPDFSEWFTGAPVSMQSAIPLGGALRYVAD